MADDDGLAGFTGCGISRDADVGPEVGEIWSFFVAVDRWRQGVGQRLMAAALDGARRREEAWANILEVRYRRALA